MFPYSKPDIPLGGCFCEIPTPVYDSVTSYDVCSSCGVVMEAVLNDEPEYGYDEDGNDISYVSSFNGMEIDFGNNRSQFANKLQDRTMSSMDIKHNEMKKTVHIICDALKISNPSIIRDQAVGLLDEMEKRNVHLNGKKRFALYAVAVFYACKLNEASRELRTFATVCSMDMKNINYAVKIFREKMPDIISQRKTSEHSVLINSTISKFDISSEASRVLRKNVLDFADEHPDIFETGRKPRTVIAALIMIMIFKFDIDIDVKKISDVMEISHSSISIAAKEITKITGVQF